MLARHRGVRGIANDADLAADDLAAITDEFKEIVRERTGKPFPTDPIEQLRLAVEAVFRSWNGKRAIDYRNAAGIAHDLGTAVNIQTMVFGNLGEGSATGVVTTRNVTDGQPEIEGDWLANAQGEDVVAGTRVTNRIATLAEAMPRVWREFAADLPEARASLPGHAGHRVHGRARQALDAADARRQAHRAGGGADRRRPHQRAPDHARAGRAARDA